MVKQMVRSQPHGMMACDRVGHDRTRWVIEKELKKGNRTMWSIGNMEGLQHGAGPMV